MKKIIPAILSSLLLSATLHAQETVKLSLGDCMEYALKHNYNIKNAKLDVLIQQAQNNEILSASYPHINGKADLNYFNIPQRSFIDGNSFNPAVPKGTIVPIQFSLPWAADANITTSQLLFDGAVFVAWKGRSTVMQLAMLNGEVTEENVRYGVLRAYNSLVIAYKQYDILKSSLAYARSLEHDLEITRKNGLAEKIEVERTSVQVNNLATDSIRIGNILSQSEDMLKYQLGMNIKTRIVLTDTNIEQHRSAAAALTSEGENYERVPEYNVATTALRLNEFSVLRYKLAALPSINGFWSYGSNYGSDRFSEITKFSKYWANSTFGLQLTVPIFNGLLRQNQLKEAKLNVEKSRNNIENLKLTLDYQAEVSRTTLKNALLQAQSQLRNLDLSADVLDLAQRKYKAGVGSNLEVTQAQTDQLRAQNNYFSALIDVVTAEADLKKALGLLK